MRYWEDIKEGEVVELGSRTMEKDRMVAFAREFDEIVIEAMRGRRSPGN